MQELYDKDPTIQNLIKNIKPDGIELNAETNAEQTDQEAVPPRDTNNTEKRIDTAAKHATNTAMGK